MSPASIGDKVLLRAYTPGAVEGATMLPSSCAESDCNSCNTEKSKPTESKLLNVTDPYCEAKVLSEAKTAFGLVSKKASSVAASAAYDVLFDGKSSAVPRIMLPACCDVSTTLETSRPASDARPALYLHSPAGLSASAAEAPLRTGPSPGVLTRHATINVQQA